MARMSWNSAARLLTRAGMDQYDQALLRAVLVATSMPDRYRRVLQLLEIRDKEGLLALAATTNLLKLRD